jgi:hypothetical protein
MARQARFEYPIIGPSTTSMTSCAGYRNSVPVGWEILIIGIVAGLIFGFRGLAILVILLAAWWIVGFVSSDYINHADSGDNIGEEAGLAALLGLAIGAAGLLAGSALRSVVKFTHRS